MFFRQLRLTELSFPQGKIGRSFHRWNYFNFFFCFLFVNWITGNFISHGASVDHFPSIFPSAIFSLTTSSSNFIHAVRLSFWIVICQEFRRALWLWFRDTTTFLVSSVAFCFLSLRTIIETFFEQAMFHKDPGRLWIIAFRYLEQARLFFSSILLSQHINGKKREETRGPIIPSRL